MDGQLAGVSNETSILIVEDSKLQAAAVAKLFQQMGFKNVRCCYKAGDALTQMRESKVEIVFCDWNMPERSGVELLQDVRSDPGLAKMPFVMVTAHAEKEKVLAAVKLGVNDYVIKPLTAAMIEEKLGRLIKNVPEA